MEVDIRQCTFSGWQPTIEIDGILLYIDEVYDTPELCRKRARKIEKLLRTDIHKYPVARREKK